MGKKRTKYLNLRLTEEEHATISTKAQAAGVTISEFIRLSAHRIWIRNRGDEKARAVALNRINSNLNQIARWANKYRSGADAVSVIRELILIERAVKRFAKGGTDDC